MADINLRINGDGSGGQEAFDDVASSADKAARSIEKSLTDASKKSSEAMSKAWEDAEASEARMAAQLAKVQTAFLAVGAAAVKFGIDSVKAFAEADRVQRQLERAAGSLAEAFSQQADALEAQLAVDGEIIKQQQTLLLQWGAAPAAIEGAVRAINDYAAATGKDAVTATTDFLHAVESGDAKLAKYGVTFEQTGDKQADLLKLTEAMTSALGGAGAARAQSLEGSLAAVSIAFGNVQESFGKLIASVEGKMGILSKLAGALQGIAAMVGAQDGLSGVANLASNPGMFALAAYQGAFGSGPTAPDMSTMGDGRGLPSASSFSLYDPKKAAANSKDGQGSIEAAKRHAKDLEDVQRRNIESMRQFQRGWDELDRHAEEAMAKEAERRAKAADELREGIERQSSQLWDTISEEEQKTAEKLSASMGAVFRSQREELKKQEEAWAEAGAAIGAALVNSIASQLERLASGEDLDAVEAITNVIGDVLAVAGQIIGTAIGSAYGGPGGAQLGGAIGGAVGGLTGAGVKAIGKASARERRGKQYHSGGWVGDEIDIPRYHSGSWIGADEQAAILQTGERVLSRAEVSRMGGPAGVDSAARGGPSFSITVQAMDSQSVRQFFENQGGRGFFNALRTGRGSLLPAFGGG